MQTRHSVDREGLMSEFSELEVGRQLIELIDGCG